MYEKRVRDPHSHIVSCSYGQGSRVNGLKYQFPGTQLQFFKKNFLEERVLKF